MERILNKVVIRKVIIVIIFLLFAYFIFTLIGINHYLNEYGYGIRELPKTVAVYFHLSKGFTVNQDEDGSYIFIGRHDYIYDEVLKKKGYYESDRLGLSGIYTKNGDEAEPNLYVLSTTDWCHWFRIYIMDGGKIEDFM